MRAEGRACDGVIDPQRKRRREIVCAGGKRQSSSAWSELRGGMQRRRTEGPASLALPGCKLTAGEEYTADPLLPSACVLEFLLLKVL